MFRNFCALACSAIVSVSAHAPNSWAMEGTEVDKDDIAAKSIVYVDVKNGENCTGVVLGKNQIITAAHCVVEGRNTKVSPTRITVYYTRNYQTDHATFRSVKDVVVYPHFELGQKKGSSRIADPIAVDIAILILSNMHPPETVEAMLPNQVETRLRKGGHVRWVHSPVAAYGFGQFGKRLYVLRTGEMVVDSDWSNLPLIEGRPRLSSTHSLAGQKTALCPGDSGGGVFYLTKRNRRIASDHGRPVLGGIIVSGGGNQCSDEGRMISLGPFFDWIVNQ